MKITPVDEQHNLFLIEDAYPSDIIDQIQEEDFLSYEWELQEGQVDWPRRKLIKKPHLIISELDPYLNTKHELISEALKVKFVYEAVDSGIWLDYSPYTCAVHLDGDLPIAMQIYLLDNAGPEHGTVFYNQDQTVRYTFPYKVNTGYIMLNGPDQYHAVPTMLAEGELRLSSYTYFGPFEHK
tara:strand:- start:420 stop:965 length:546 start_codon:yes stop_codon:yes gene_type:complete